MKMYLALVLFLFYSPVFAVPQSNGQNPLQISCRAIVDVVCDDGRSSTITYDGYLNLQGKCIPGVDPGRMLSDCMGMCPGHTGAGFKCNGVAYPSNNTP